MPCRLFLIFVALAALIACSVQTAAAQTLKREKIISIDMSNADLHAVVSMLARQADLSITVRDGDVPYHRVNAHAQDAPVTKAIQLIASSAGAIVTRNADGGYLFTPSTDLVPTTPTKKGQVSLLVQLMTISSADLDSLGINFTDIPLPLNMDAPAAKPTFLHSATGPIVRQLYHTLTRTHGHILTSQTLTTGNDGIARFSLKDALPPVQSVHGNMTLIPHLNTDLSTTLELRTSGLNLGNLVTLRTIADGEMLVLVDPIPRADNASFFGRLFQTRGRQPEGQTLCVFITPTLIQDGTADRKGQGIIVTP